MYSNNLQITATKPHELADFTGGVEEGYRAK